MDETALPGVNYWYWADVRIEGISWALLGPVAAQPGGGASAVLDAPQFSHIAAAVPNPSRGMVILSYGIAEEGRVSLKIYAVNGRLVASVVGNVVTPIGWHEVSWSGQEDHGISVSAGIYFAQLSGGGKRVGNSHRIVLAR